MAAQTIEDRIKAVKNPAGFDYMRLVLSLMIVAWHTIPVCYSDTFEYSFVTGWPRPFRAIVLPMFFALSGFLVASSLERCRTLISFLGLRALRLLPALIVESLLAIVVLGVVFTKLPIGQYFHQRETWHYLGNVVGLIHYSLPGVFSNLPTHDVVNSQLWTLPFEMMCYGTISLIYFFRCYRSKPGLIACLIAFQVFVIIRLFMVREKDTGALDGEELVMGFLYGIAIFRFRENIPWNNALGVVMGVLTFGLLCFHATFPIAPLPAAYLTVWLGLKNPPKMFLVENLDLSYPIFLYGFPLQQAVYALTPWARVWWSNFILAMIPIALIAFASWHLVERPLGKRLRPYIYKIETALVDAWLLSGRALSKVLPPGLRTRWGSSGQQE